MGLHCENRCPYDVPERRHGSRYGLRQVTRAAACDHNAQ
jgi:hypothetical protein